MLYLFDTSCAFANLHNDIVAWTILLMSMYASVGSRVPSGSFITGGAGTGVGKIERICIELLNHDSYSAKKNTEIYRRAEMLKFLGTQKFFKYSFT